MLPALQNIKNKLLSVVQECNKPVDPATLTQSLDVRTTKGTVNVIQIQAINQVVTVNLLDVIRDIEALDEGGVIPLNADPIIKACEYFHSNAYSYNDMHKAMKKAYTTYVLGESDTVTDAANSLGVQRPYLSKLRNEHGINTRKTLL